MGIILEAVRRARTNAKLKRGRCGQCETPLRDDETSRYCSDECAEQHIIDFTV